VLEAAGVPNGEQPKYFMLNLVYAASVIETPSRITRARVEIRGALLKVRSETQYLQAYLSLSAPYTPSFPPCQLRFHSRTPPPSLLPRTAFHFGT